MTEKRTLLITKQGGEEFQVDIPVDWKVTYGPAVVGFSKEPKGMSSGGSRVPMALRLYETDKMQRAIFTDVVSFRDMSIPIRVKKVNTQEKDGFMECEGVRKRTIFQAATVSWIDPDAQEAEEKLPQLSMPKDTEMFGEGGAKDGS